MGCIFSYSPTPFTQVTAKMSDDGKYMVISWPENETPPQVGGDPWDIKAESEPPMNYFGSNYLYQPTNQLHMEQFYQKPPAERKPEIRIESKFFNPGTNYVFTLTTHVGCNPNDGSWTVVGKTNPCSTGPPKFSSWRAIVSAQQVCHLGMFEISESIMRQLAQPKYPGQKILSLFIHTNFIGKTDRAGRPTYRVWKAGLAVASPDEKYAQLIYLDFSQEWGGYDYNGRLRAESEEKTETYFDPREVLAAGREE